MKQLTRNKYLTPEELSRLKATLSDDRNGLLIKLAIATGGRASEILAVKASDLADGCVEIHGIKGSNSRTIPLPKLLYKQLQNLPQGVDGRIFPIGYPRLAEIWQDYSPNGKTFHSLRHTFAVELYKKTKDITLVQLALGHTNIQNTLVYAVVVDAGAKLRAALVSA